MIESISEPFLTYLGLTMKAQTHPSDLGSNYWYYEDEQGRHYELGILSTYSE